MDPFEWPAVDRFINRESELERLDGWWRDDRQPLAMIGRRRVGKSWLFRRFAHEKDAVVLVAEDLPTKALLTRFSEHLEPVLGVRPHLPDVAGLFETLYRAGRDRQLLVVVDEFPIILGASAAKQRQTLSSIQAVMERERDGSNLKLVLCGSQVALMEALFAERNPLHGRLTRMDVAPLEYRSARQFLHGLDPLASFERYAVAGGMPLYLDRLGTGSLKSVVCAEVLSPMGPLFNEGRMIVDELREPRTYFGILTQLATGAKQTNEIAQVVGKRSNALAPYLSNLKDLKLVSRSLPFGAAPDSRQGQWRLDDPFLRFWFRFVFPFQDDLQTGLEPGDLFESEVRQNVADHVSPLFESWCLRWMRLNLGTEALNLGRWWGNAANRFRRSEKRSSEEIDAIGGRNKKITVLGEAKWTSRAMGPDVLNDLREFKIPALIDADFKVIDRPRIVLFSKSGYNKRLTELAENDSSIMLVDVSGALANLD